MAVVFFTVPLETVTARKLLEAGVALANATGRMATATEEAATQDIAASVGQARQGAKKRIIERAYSTNARSFGANARVG
jgi:hypothetical protein